MGYVVAGDQMRCVGADHVGVPHFSPTGRPARAAGGAGHRLQDARGYHLARRVVPHAIFGWVCAGKLPALAALSVLHAGAWAVHGRGRARYPAGLADHVLHLSHAPGPDGVSGPRGLRSVTLGATSRQAAGSAGTGGHVSVRGHRPPPALHVRPRVPALPRLGAGGTDDQVVCRTDAAAVGLAASGRKDGTQVLTGVEAD
mmetsp:Transcript_11801/g.33236  ORF Transcript_11801/g.33236 Transcript_11801/m.33236 type:complete len:200 (+) Transcript_11801:847-1446(+)